LNNHKQIQGKMEKSTNNGKLVVAVLVGVAIGGTLGILFAPNKGSITRKKLFSRGEDAKDAIEDKYHSLLDGAKKSVEKVVS
jgi:gas vesicle protein